MLTLGDRHTDSDDTSEGRITDVADPVSMDTGVENVKKNGDSCMLICCQIILIEICSQSRA